MQAEDAQGATSGSIKGWNFETRSKLVDCWADEEFEQDGQIQSLDICEKVSIDNYEPNDNDMSTTSEWSEKATEVLVESSAEVLSGEAARGSEHSRQRMLERSNAGEAVASWCNTRTSQGRCIVRSARDLYKIIDCPMQDNAPFKGRCRDNQAFLSNYHYAVLQSRALASAVPRMHVYRSTYRRMQTSLCGSSYLS